MSSTSYLRTPYLLTPPTSRPPSTPDPPTGPGSVSIASIRPCGSHPWSGGAHPYCPTGTSDSHFRGARVGTGQGRVVRHHSSPPPSPSPSGPEVRRPISVYSLVVVESIDSCTVPIRTLRVQSRLTGPTFRLRSRHHPVWYVLLGHYLFLGVRSPSHSHVEVCRVHSRWRLSDFSPLGVETTVYTSHHTVPPRATRSRGRER